MLTVTQGHPGPVRGIFRLLWGSERTYTHFNKEYKTVSRLYFFLIDENLAKFPVCHTDISHGYNSDHSYVSLNIQSSSIEKGRWYWKLNNSHLRDDEFVNEVNKEIIDGTLNSSFDSYSTRGCRMLLSLRLKILP